MDAHHGEIQFFQQPSFELRLAVLDVSSVASQVVTWSVELNGNFFVLSLVLGGNHDVDVQHGGSVEIDDAVLKR